MKSEENKPQECVDCKGYPVSHANEWFSALFDYLFSPIAWIFDWTAGFLNLSFFNDIFARMALPWYKTLAFFRLGTITNEMDQKDPERNQLVWIAAKQQGITLYEFRFLGRPNGINFFIAQRGGETISFEGLPRANSGYSRSISWMDDKAALKKNLVPAGIPMARGRACMTYAQALKTINEVGVPVITKPNLGSHSRHATVGIRTPEELAIGFRRAQKLSPWVVVEQELQGYLFRILLVKGNIAGIVRRESPNVIGDGVSSLRELVEKENKNPKRDGVNFHLLPTDVAADWDSIPPKDQMVCLDIRISRWYGGSTTDFTDRAHPDNIALFKHIAKVLGDPLVGVDFIIGDMTRSWRDQKLCGVIECNSLPNIGLHQEVLYGKSRDVAGLLFEAAFS